MQSLSIANPNGIRGHIVDACHFGNQSRMAEDHGLVKRKYGGAGDGVSGRAGQYGMHMGQETIAQNDNNGGNLGFEAELFKAADKLRGNMEPSDYKHIALGLIFLKYISDAFEARHARP
ncbi:MAG: type I restriction-modification system subunit M N-terminal domain-containing protein [Zoogloeaceae bacterium]|nr:type I restriction-modification system subunit M N-terminal domain-containing protein [Zoogloeaceae bacterium]